MAAGVAAQGLGLGALRDLVEVGVIEPQRLAVGDDGLLERLGVDEPELAGTLEFELAAGVLGARRLAILGRGRDGLGEFGAAGLGILHEGFQALEAIGPRGRRACRDHNCSQQTFHSFSMIAGKRAHSPARAGTSTSRCPLAVRPLTRPAFSISSSRRAERL